LRKVADRRMMMVVVAMMMMMMMTTTMIMMRCLQGRPWARMPCALEVEGSAVAAEFLA
jgi:hypothetical protein